MHYDCFPLGDSALVSRERADPLLFHVLTETSVRGFI